MIYQMNLKHQTVKIITDKNDKIILKFPIDTVLDNIIDDLWNNIIKYMDYQPFLIAIPKYALSGYRLIREDEFDSKKFLDYYFNNRSIPYLGDTIGPSYAILIVGNYYVINKGEKHNWKMGIKVNYGKTIKFSCANKITKDSNLIVSNKIKGKMDEYYNIYVPDV